jgi:hypothetical protein
MGNLEDFRGKQTIRTSGKIWKTKEKCKTMGNRKGEEKLMCSTKGHFQIFLSNKI